MYFNLILTIIVSANILATLVFMMACAVSGRQSRGEGEVVASPRNVTRSPARHYTSAPMNRSAAAHA